ncbi:uncharacterized protein EV420DRAFT_1649883 [Desarmillaria tabescens]|uniref:Uncharacterized protein n=1 Tax=Armillaria tabescens TaxID=1929756 RepID=A0AA39JFF4_ARMTA|nr:uncharacterized protein EV420DRAFT_1649883 [Desarmillaria tabescens]KAK0441772.1 hypothetical protein EV420DRAFT_1649883 [Desarmillaria tabescens]
MSYRSSSKIQKAKEAHVDLFTHHLRNGLDVDDMALLASEEDQTRRRLYAIARNDPAIADAHVGLVDVFNEDNKGLFLSTLSDVSLQCTLFTDPAGGHFYPEGDPVMVSSLQQFENSWKSFTENMLSEIDWNNVAVAGGSVLACLDHLSPKILDSPIRTRQYHQRWYPDSDIDVFLYSLSPEDAERKIVHIYDVVRGSVPYNVICVHTKNTVSIHSQYPFRVIQIVLWLYSSISEILMEFDVDSACFLYDGYWVWSNPRGIVALMRQANTVDLTWRLPSYELRLVKYASRGFRILIPLLRQENINPEIYHRRPSELQGLAWLLCMEHLISRQTQNLKHPDTEKVFKVHSLVVDGMMESCQPHEISDYAHFHVPHGPKWNTAKIECHIINADHLLNSKELNLDPVWKLAEVQDEAHVSEAWHLHHHPAFCGSAQDCLEGCQSCTQPRTPHEVLVLADWSKKYVRGHVKFFEHNAGRQFMSGSFNLIDIGD